MPLHANAKKWKIFATTRDYFVCFAVKGIGAKFHFRLN